jgi:hypothetical protein
MQEQTRLQAAIDVATATLGGGLATADAALAGICRCEIVATLAPRSLSAFAPRAAVLWPAYVECHV